MPDRMNAVVVPEPGANFELVQREVPTPGPGEIRIRVEACGICHSDAVVKEGTWPDLQYPRIPGHEVAGVVDALGPDVDAWSQGDRVGVGWHGGHCFTCDPCRRGDFINCENGAVTGVTRDGGFADYMLARSEAVAAVPEAVEPAHAAPLLCAGITTFNALRNTDAGPGDLVAVQGIGGLGHLGVAYAAEMGFRVAAVSRGTEKREEALELGADHFVDSRAEDPSERLAALGGARVILATAPNSDAVSELVGGLGIDGRLLVVAAEEEPVEVSPMELIMGRKSVSGWPSGDARDSQDTLEFSAARDVRPEIEEFALAEAGEAYDRMMAGDVRFRSVLRMG